VDGRYGLKRGVERGKTTLEEADAALGRLSWTTNLEDVKYADLIIEAVPEDMELKKKVFGELDGIAGAGTIFASNTSGLAISELNKAVSQKRQARFIGMHWFSPAPVMKLVELVHAPETAEETIQALESLCQRAGKATVRVKDAPGRYGFIANRIYFAAVREAQAVLAEGIATPEDINKAMVFGFNWPVGPLAMVEGATKGWQ
jgi:3-hydroxyacyl-CoA dehydrogenase